LQFSIISSTSCTTDHLVYCNSLFFSSTLFSRVRKERSCLLLVVPTTFYLVGVSLLQFRLSTILHMFSDSQIFRCLPLSAYFLDTYFIVRTPTSSAIPISQQFHFNSLSGHQLYVYVVHLTFLISCNTLWLPFAQAPTSRAIFFFSLLFEYLSPFLVGVSLFQLTIDM